MTSVITTLWLAGNLPIRDGLYRSDGWAQVVQVDASVPGGLVLLEPFDLGLFLQQDLEWLSSIDIMLEEELPDGSGYLCGGEGSHGSDGFFGRLDRHKNLVWVVFLEDGNPFIEVVIAGTRARFRSSSEVLITVDLTTPEFGLTPDGGEPGPSS